MTTPKYYPAASKIKKERTRKVCLKILNLYDDGTCVCVVYIYFGLSAAAASLVVAAVQQPVRAKHFLIGDPAWKTAYQDLSDTFV